jgi:branched-chain amino acid aminotransferase
MAQTVDRDAIVYFDGEFKPYRDVHIGLLTHGLMYGTGCFEGIRAYWNDEHEKLYMVQPVAHYERFHQSANILKLELKPSVEELVEITAELLRRNGVREDTYVRPLLFKSGEGVGVPVREVPESLAIASKPMDMYLDTQKGIRCQVSTWRRVPDISIPARAKVTGIYINSVLAKLEATDNGYDEAIMLDQSGHVSEGSAENIFIKRGADWITPPASSDILEGVTRKMLMELITQELGLRVVERVVARTELYVADEILLCGTGAEITPVTDVDGRTVGTGKVGDSTAKLQELFFSIVRGNDARYASWLVAV